MNKYLCLTLIVIFFCSCKEKREHVPSIRILYFNTLFDGVVDVSCEEIVAMPIEADTIGNVETGELGVIYSGVIDTIILNKGAISEVKELLSQLEKGIDYGLDARMKCYIDFYGTNIDSLCLDMWGDHGYYNNSPVMIPNKLTYLLRNSSGYYKWFDVERMSNFDELNDPSFEREKAISRSGEMY